MISQFDCWVWSMDVVLVKVPGCLYLWLFVGLMASGCSPGCCCCLQGANYYYYTYTFIHLFTIIFKK